VRVRTRKRTQKDMLLPTRQAPAVRSVLLLSAALAVTIGISVYLLARDWSDVRFLAPFATWQHGAPVRFGQIGYFLPSLTHAYAFALLIILGLWPVRNARQIGAVAWLLIALGLECLQSGVVQAAVLNLANRAGWSPVTGYSIHYLFGGRFDAADLLATAIGVFVAYVASSVLEKAS